MIVSFIYEKKKKQLNIDTLESILSIKNKINHEIFNDDYDINQIQLFYNHELLKNYDYPEKLKIDIHSQIHVHLKKKGGNFWKKLWYYLICVIIIVIPLFILPSAFDAISSNLLSQILSNTKDQFSKYLMCELHYNTLVRRMSGIVDLIKYILFILFTYVIITMPCIIACLMAKGKTLSDNPKSLCTPLYVGTTTGLIFTSIYFFFYFMLRFSDKMLIPLIEYSKTNQLTNIIVRPFLNFIYYMFNSFKYFICYLIPYFGQSTKSYHIFLDATVPSIFSLLNSISSVGCKDNININALKQMYSKNIKNINQNNQGSNSNNQGSKSNNQEETTTNNRGSSNTEMLINNKLLNIQFTNGIIDNFGIDKQLNNMRNKIENKVDPLCQEEESNCCNVKMLGTIADALYDSIQNPIVKKILETKDLYFGAVLAVQGMYESMMSFEPIQLDVSGQDNLQKKITLKSISINDKKFLNDSLVQEINKVIDNVDSTNENIDLMFKKIYDYLHKNNIQNGPKKDSILEKIGILEDEAKKLATQEDSEYQKGRNNTKEFIKLYMINAICNIFESANSGQQLLVQLGGLNNLMDILKCSSAIGGFIAFFYIVTVIILIICGFLGVY